MLRQKRFAKNDVIIRVDGKGPLPARIVQVIGLEVVRPIRPSKRTPRTTGKSATIRWNYLPHNRSRKLAAKLRELEGHLNAHYRNYRKLQRTHSCGVSVLVIMPQDWVSCGALFPAEFLRAVSRAGLYLEVTTGLGAELASG
jgi:hypothetical protein